MKSVLSIKYRLYEKSFLVILFVIERRSFVPNSSIFKLTLQISLYDEILNVARFLDFSFIEKIFFGYYICEEKKNKLQKTVSKNLMFNALYQRKTRNL